MSTAPWHRLHGEPETAYQVFTLYAQSAPPRLPPARFGATYNVLPWVVLDWCRDWQWDRRLAAFDAWYDKQHAQRLAALAAESAEASRAKNRELIVMAREYAADQLAKHLAESRKSAYSRTKPREIAQVMKLAIQLDALLDDRVLAANRGASVVDNWGADLDDDELAEFDRITNKAAGRGKADIR